MQIKEIKCSFKRTTSGELDFIRAESQGTAVSTDPEQAVLKIQQIMLKLADKNSEAHAKASSFTNFNALLMPLGDSPDYTLQLISSQPSNPGKIVLKITSEMAADFLTPIEPKNRGVTAWGLAKQACELAGQAAGLGDQTPETLWRPAVKKHSSTVVETLSFGPALVRDTVKMTQVIAGQDPKLASEPAEVAGLSLSVVDNTCKFLNLLNDLGWMLESKGFANNVQVVGGLSNAAESALSLYENKLDYSSVGNFFKSLFKSVIPALRLAVKFTGNLFLNAFVTPLGAAENIYNDSYGLYGRCSKLYLGEDEDCLTVALLDIAQKTSSIALTLLALSTIVATESVYAPYLVFGFMAVNLGAQASLYFYPPNH